MWELKNGKWSMLVDYGKWNKIDNIKERLQQNPDDMKALLVYADILQWQTKQFPEAEAALRKLGKVYPERTDLLIDMAVVLSMQGKMDEAEKYLVKIKDAGLLNRNVFTRLGGLLQRENKFAESIIYFEKALQMKEEGREYFSLARAFAFNNEKNKAFLNLDKAIGLGYNSKQQFENDQALRSLKSDGKWQELLGRLK
jgi:tetratricopeptide (TPR) repeat protein